jgi:hypothetical protein
MDFSKLSDDELQLAEKLAKWTKGNFNEDQFNIAKKVQERAKLKELNPDFVLSLVMAESGFNPKATSKKGAIGIMQLMPDTAKSLKVDPYDMDQNIEGGLNLIKELVSNKKIGNDPYKVLAGYNTSTETRNKFLESGDLSVLPDETINYMDRVSSLYGNTLPGVDSQGGQPEASAEAPPAEAEEPKEVANVEVPQGTTESNVDESSLPYALIGGYTGAHIAGGIETTKQLAPLVPNLINRVSGNTPNPSKPMARWGLQNYLNSQLSPNLKMPLSELEKVSGGTKIRTMAEVQNALKAIQEVKSQRTPKTVSTNPATGQPRQIFSNTPGRPAVDLSKYERTANIFSKAADEASNVGQMVKGALPSVARVGVGALGGALAGSQMYDAFKDYQKEGQGLHMPSGRTAAKFASGAGGALATLPFGVTQGAGLVLQAPELAYQASDYYDTLKERRKNATKEDTDRMLMNVDPMGNPM